jgi:hypothetical protein
MNTHTHIQAVVAAMANTDGRGVVGAAIVGDTLSWSTTELRPQQDGCCSEHLSCHWLVQLYLLLLRCWVCFCFFFQQVRRCWTTVARTCTG